MTRIRSNQANSTAENIFIPRRAPARRRRRRTRSDVVDALGPLADGQYIALPPGHAGVDGGDRLVRPEPHLRTPQRVSGTAEQGASGAQQVAQMLATLRSTLVRLYPVKSHARLRQDRGQAGAIGRRALMLTYVGPLAGAAGLSGPPAAGLVGLQSI